LLLSVAGALLGLWLAEGRLSKAWAKAASAVLGAALTLVAGTLLGWLDRWLPVYGYGTLILAGFLLGVWLAARRSAAIGIAPHHCLDLGLWGVVGGLFGARLFYVIQYWSHYSPFGPEGPRGLLRVFAFWEGGLVFFGAFVAAILTAVFYCRRHHLPTLPFLDLAAPSLIAGQALGRLGCFMRGCCFGKETALPWAVRFPPESEAYSDYAARGLLPAGSAFTAPLHPTQLYAFLGAALAAAFLYAFWRRRRFDGQVFGLMLVLAGVTRFFEEFLRADVEAAFPSISESLTVAQWFSLLLVPAGVAWLAFVARRARNAKPRS
jgi:phosphatidylglycerol:prolipoprotein diacylglycerol transferase